MATLTERMLGAALLERTTYEEVERDRTATAQALGVPCITTLHSGNPETIPPIGHTFVVPERDPIALAGAMRAMIDQSAQGRSALQEAGREWIEQNYDLEKTIAGYAELYRRLSPRPRYSGGEG